MTKKEITRFLDSHPIKEISAARMEYTLYLHPDFEPNLLNAANASNTSEEDLAMEEKIREAETPDDFFSLMRKQMNGLNRRALRQRLLASETELMPMICRKSMTNTQDIFIENALYFFLYCEENVCGWIMENYQNFRSRYLQGMFCLVIGFRGTAEMIPFLINAAGQLEKACPEETFDQGPYLAVSELALRFYGIRQK